MPNITATITGPDEVRVTASNGSHVVHLDLTPAEALNLSAVLAQRAGGARRKALGDALANAHKQYADREA